MGSKRQTNKLSWQPSWHSLLIFHHLIIVALALSSFLVARYRLVDVRDNSRLHEVSILADEFVELWVISDGEHDVSRHDPLLLEPLSLITRELNNLRADVLES